MKEQNRIITCKIRLTEEERDLFISKSANYNSMSTMIRKAVEELDNRAAKGKIDILEDITYLYSKYNLEISHISGNLNQVVKRVNQLSISNSLNVSFLEQQLFPQIEKVHKIIFEINRIQKSIFSRLMKL